MSFGGNQSYCKLKDSFLPVCFLGCKTCYEFACSHSFALSCDGLGTIAAAFLTCMGKQKDVIEWYHSLLLCSVFFDRLFVHVSQFGVSKSVVVV